jgi:ubiquinone/menaquinone biosynthesis C-methylase UbiE
MKLDPRLGRILKNPSGVKVIASNFVSAMPGTFIETQSQTSNAFSDKWNQYRYGSADFDRMVEHQKAWYLDLYGFDSETALANFLNDCSLVLDAGAGKCHKAAWFAELSPSTLVLAADISESLNEAAEHYKHIDNLFFVRCDIGRMPFFSNELFDYVSCDQVIHHTADPFTTFRELVRIIRSKGALSVYVYRKKALPRELLDEHFRQLSRSLGHDQLMELSEQLTELGRVLSSLNQELEIPQIPVLGIEGGKMTVQRFLYWNFLKCFWSEDQGFRNSVMINYDWYSPSQAFRYSEQEFRSWIEAEELQEIHFHKERACYSGRFLKH